MMSDMEELSTTTESETSEAVQPSDSPQETTTEQSSADDAGLLTTQEGDDSDDVEISGEKYRVPKALAAHLEELKQAGLRQDDYTRKTQSVAEKAREYEERAQQLQAREQFQQQYIEAVADVKSIDKQLANYQKLDWNGLMDADPVQAMKLDRQMRELQQQRTQIVSGIEQTQAQQSFAQSQATARQRETAMKQLQSEIKGFGTPEVTKALIEVGQKSGYEPHELANVTDPRAVKLLHKAYLYDQLVAKQTQSAKPTSAEVKPITRVSPGSGAVKKSISDPGLSMEEFIKARNEMKRRK